MDPYILTLQEVGLPLPFRGGGGGSVWSWEGQLCSQAAQLCTLAATSNLWSQPQLTHL